MKKHCPLDDIDTLNFKYKNNYTHQAVFYKEC